MLWCECNRETNITTTLTQPLREAEGRLIIDMLRTALKLLPDERDAGELKLMTAALKGLEAIPARGSR